MESTKEILGFFSRWCLLGLAGYVIVLVATVAVVAGITRASGPAGAVWSDGIWEPWRELLFWAHLDAPETITRKHQFYGDTPEGELMYSSSYRGHAFLNISHRKQGRVRLKIRGIPYGDFAGCENRIHCTVVPAGRNVFALDARLAEEVSLRVQGIEDVVKILQGRGEVVFLHVGPPSAYAAVRQKLRQRFPQQLQIFWSGDQGKPIDVLQHISWTLHRKPALPMIITTDEDFALTAVEENFPAHWIGGHTQHSLPGKLTTHATLQAFAESFGN